MRIFYDCEFVERGRDIPIKLVSIGMRREDGQEFYGINAESISDVVRHPWCAINVAPLLPIRFDDPMIFEWDRNHPDYDAVMALDILSARIYEFIMEPGEPIELWAYYGAYDHVVLCQTFGSMAERPPGIPMYTRDIQQLMDEYPLAKLPTDHTDIHHALADARWVAQAYHIIRATYAPVKLSGPITLALESGE